MLDHDSLTHGQNIGYIAGLAPADQVGAIERSPFEPGALEWTARRNQRCCPTKRLSLKHFPQIVESTSSEQEAQLGTNVTSAETVVDDNITRVYLRQRGPTYPTIERFVVIAPDLAPSK